MTELHLPRTWFGRAWTGLRAFRKLIRNPADPIQGPLFQMCVERSLHEKLAARMRGTPEGARLLERRLRLNAGTVSLEEMRRLPDGSLGHAYGRYFEEQGIQPFTSQVDGGDRDEDYVCTRLREIHDVVHVVTGYDTDEIGELELQCFCLGNMPWGPIPWITLIGAGVLGIYSKHGGLRRVYPRLREAYRRGREARCLAHVIWEDHWEMPVDRLRQLLCAA